MPCKQRARDDRHSSTDVCKRRPFQRLMPATLLHLLLAASVARAGNPSSAQAVSEAAALQLVLQRGSRHVVIADHLDLGGLETVPCTIETPDEPLICVNDASYSFPLSIRGECQSEYPGTLPGNPPLYSAQCVLSTPSLWLQVEGRDLWIHNLHVLLRSTGSGFLQQIWKGSRVWHTQFGLQGPGPDADLSLAYVGGAKTLFMGGFFGDAARSVGGAALLCQAGSCSLQHTQVARVQSTGAETMGAVFGNGDVGDTYVMCRNCSFTGVAGPALAKRDTAIVFADSDMQVLDEDVGGNVSAEAVDRAPQGVLLTGRDEAFVEIVQEAEDMLPTDDGPGVFVVLESEGTPSTRAPAGPSPPGSNATRPDSKSWAPVIGIVVVLILAVLLYRHRNKFNAAARNDPSTELGAAMDSPSRGGGAQCRSTGGEAVAFHTPGPPSLAARSSVDSDTAWKQAPVVSRNSAGSGLASVRATATTASDVGGLAGESVLSGPSGQSVPSSAPSSMSPRSHTACTLDRLVAEGHLLFDKFKLTGVAGGGQQRRWGGQAVVQFVEHARSRERLAAKFFTRDRDFRREREVYGIDALRAVLPEIVYVHEGGWQPRQWQGTKGHSWALPPCLVMHRGESLSEYVQAAGYDVFMTVHALGQVVTKLQALHEQGWVHRDLKPGNVLWSASQRSWSLLDFGCAARIGSVARLEYSLPYAAPEVLQAAQEGRGEMSVGPEQDMWSMGVVAFEMLTEQPLFPRMTVPQAIEDAILARNGRKMPWEDEALKQSLLKKMGMFKRSVLACLERDPRKRVGCRALLRMWAELFSAQTQTSIDK